MPFEGQKFVLTQKFISGYQNKLQADELPEGALMDGSQNVVLDDDGKWRTRFGTRYLGTKSTLTGGCTSAGKLRRRDGIEMPVVAFGIYTKYLHPLQNQAPTGPTAGTGGTPDWALLENNWTAGYQLGFATSDLATDDYNNLVMCNGNDVYRVWNGSYALVSQWTGDTIVTQSATLLSDNLFPVATPSVPYYLQVSKKGVVLCFKYTGITDSTFTGVTPAPWDGYGGGVYLESGDAITLSPVQYPDAPKGNVLLTSDNARILVGNVLNSHGFHGGGQLYGSKTRSASDFTFSDPRKADDGFILNICEGGGTITGGAHYEDKHYIFKPATIKTVTFSQDGNDIPQLQSLNSYDEKNSPDDGSVGALSVFRAANSLVYVTPNRTIQEISRLSTYDYLQSLPISDAIKKLTDQIPFDYQTAGIFWRGRSFIACKSSTQSSTNDTLLVYNHLFKVWEPPTVGLAIGAFFAYESGVYGCLATSPDVVKLWDGTTDFTSDMNDEAQAVGFPINAQFTFGWQNYGARDKRKEFDQYFIEGEMATSGSATFTVQYDEGGETRSGTLLGTESGFFFKDASSGGFGDQAFGVETFGGDTSTGDVSTGASRFRVILTTKVKPFWVLRFSISTSAYFKLLAHGPNVRITPFVTPSSTKKKLA